MLSRAKLVLSITHLPRPQVYTSLSRAPLHTGPFPGPDLPHPRPGRDPPGPGGHGGGGGARGLPGAMHGAEDSCGGSGGHHQHHQDQGPRGAGQVQRPHPVQAFPCSKHQHPAGRKTQVQNGECLDERL